MSTRYGGFLDDITLFDAAFFSIAPREAIQIDPQQRLVLEASWEALESACISPDEIRGSRGGVFFGMHNNSYWFAASNNTAEEIDTYWAVGNSDACISGRVSYFLGLMGPSMSINTACSGSLVGVHQACESLRREECDMALAGGVKVNLLPYPHISTSKADMLSPEGRCKTFAVNANGYVRTEGCGVVVLKRLDAARRDNDRILAVIRGSAVNQDGASGGLTVPNGPAQEAVIRQALSSGNLEPHDIDYVEAHGTGTPLGDPIEVGALGSVYAAGRPVSAPLLVGSSKTNLGHAESAAGILSLLKLLVCFRRKAFPPHILYGEPSPYIDWEGLNVKITDRTTDWPKKR